MEAESAGAVDEHCLAWLDVARMFESVVWCEDGICGDGYYGLWDVRGGAWDGDDAVGADCHVF